MNEGSLTLIPAPTNAANDAGVDGRLTILPPTSTNPAAVQPTARLVNDRLLITGTNGDDRILVAPCGANQLRVRVGNRMLGTFPMPSGLAIDSLAGNDYVVSAFSDGPAIIAGSGAVTTNGTDFIFAAERTLVVESPTSGRSVTEPAPAADLSAHELALLQLLTD